jgi:WhiB family transcriptional regulator, redox-sensing transcriptional regulator
MDSSLFFPAARPDFGEKYTIEAKKICDACEVKSQCYMYALRYELHGFWGGTTPPERRRLRKAAGISVETPTVAYVQTLGHGTAAGYQRHMRLGLQPCASCSNAHAVQKRALRYQAQENRATTKEERKTERLREGAGGDYPSALGTSRRMV